MAKAVSPHGGLEGRLVLLGWLHDLLGYESTAGLLDATKHSEEGFGPDGHSHVNRILRSRKLSLDRNRLDMYDANIRRHLESINAGRDKPLTLKYFQYLAILYAEIFLDFKYSGELLPSLNKWVERLNDKMPNGSLHKRFTEDELGKLAFWMATGSGKTIIMHINYLQFKHYRPEPMNNVLLITPNIGLSKQHIRDLKRSCIQAGHFTGRTANDIDVIEITRFKTERSRKGKTVQVDAFGDGNLVFVDEGHKGYGGESWLGVRDSLGKTGFTFEYSATFGQALGAAKDIHLAEEYGRAIIFDYSYHYFYHDGYGKDFAIVNMDRDAEGMTDTLLLANMLAFYEQRLVFDEHAADLQPYNLDRPLWVFAGSSVNAVRTEKKKPRSDILRVVRFLHRLLAGREWAEAAICDILAGRFGLKDGRGDDIFGDRFGYLRGRASIYDDMLKRVLHTKSGGGLRLHRISGSEGEIGMKAGSEDYFGVINIGDRDRFEKLVGSSMPDVMLEHDMISGSLFAGINDKNTTVEVLVGAKKFTEGWNSWRVSAMGLLNMGRSEGSQIIQMFGRGVRLRGENMSLKRSSAASGHPDYVRYLETLNIFALRASYMAQFREYLEREGAPVRGMVDIHLSIRADQALLGSGLVVPCLRKGAAFGNEAIALGVDGSVKVTVDTSPKITVTASGSGGIGERQVAAQAGRKIKDLEWVDMHGIYIELLKRKSESNWHNMIVRPHTPEDILRNGGYKIVAKDTLFRPVSHDDMLDLQEAAAKVVLTYAEKFYKMRLSQWESSHMECVELGDEHPNFQDYTITIPGDDESLVAEIRSLAGECNRIYDMESGTLPGVHFDRHLYLPLLREPKDNIKISPPGLNEGETRFVKDLREYCENGKLAGELFLLRNQSRKGIGFFGDRGIYPDFILWIKSRGAQRVVFVEPHGMFYDNEPDRNDKVRLCGMLRGLTNKQQPGMAGVTLDSYVISETPLDELAKMYGGDWNDRLKFTQHHILFPDDDYIPEIIHGTTAFMPHEDGSG